MAIPLALGNRCLAAKFFLIVESMNLWGESWQPSGFICPGCTEFLEVDEFDEEGEPLCPHCGHSFGVVLGTTLTYTQGPEAKPGSRSVGHFDLIRVLGTGSFGSVWLARDTKLDRQVALKLPRVVVENSMVLHEAKTAAKLNHPNIVSVHEVGQYGEQIYIACEYIDGKTLGAAMAAGRLAIGQIIQIFIKLAAAAAHAHSEGVIHRDLKPSNVLLADAGEPVIADFGIAKMISADETITADGAIIGTVGYMAPEQALGLTHETDHRADVYALGVMLFESLTGSLPFRGNAQAVIRQTSSDDPPSPRRLDASIPADLETICLKCLEREVGKRYQTAVELKDELERFRQNRPIMARPISSMQRGLRWCRRQPVIAGLLAGIVLSLSIGLASSSFLWVKSEENAAMTRQELYRSQLNLAGMRWSKGDLTGVREILDDEPVANLARVNDDFGYRYFRSAMKPIRQIVSHGEPLVDVAVSSDGALFASAEKTNVIRVWSSANGQLLRTLRLVSGQITAIEFSRSGNHLASSHNDGRIRLWNPIMHGNVLREFNHGPGLSQVRFVPGQTRMVSVGSAGGVQVWDIDLRNRSSEIVGKIPYDGKIVDARITRDGQRLAVAGGDGRISVFDLNELRLDKELPRYNGVLALSFIGDDERTLAAASRGASCRIYSLDSGELVHSMRGGGAIGDMEYIQNIGRLALASSAKTLTLYDEAYRIRNLISTHVRTYGLIAQSADSTALVVGSDDGTVKLFDLPVFQQPTISWHDASLRGVVFTGENRVATCGEDGSVISWDLESGDQKVLRGSTGVAVRSIAVIDSGRRLAVAGAQHSIDFVDLETSEVPSEPRSLALPFAGIAAVSYQEEADLLAVGGRNGWVQVYGKTLEGEPIWENKSSDAPVNDVCFSENRKRLSIAYSNRTIRVVDFLDDGEFREVLIPLQKVPTAITNYAEGRMIAAGTTTGEIIIISVSGESPMRTIKCHGSRINSLTVLPNETQIVSGGLDRDLQLWDINSGKRVTKFWGHARQIFGVAVASDGQTIVSVGLEGDLRIWRGEHSEGEPGSP